MGFLDCPCDLREQWGKENNNITNQSNQPDDRNTIFNYLCYVVQMFKKKRKKKEIYCQDKKRDNVI